VGALVAVKGRQVAELFETHRALKRSLLVALLVVHQATVVPVGSVTQVTLEWPVPRVVGTGGAFLMLMFFCFVALQDTMDTMTIVQMSAPKAV
jgi:hypothetical protein